mgnify:CR=1 FL=1
MLCEGLVGELVGGEAGEQIEREQISEGDQITLWRGQIPLWRLVREVWDGKAGVSSFGISAYLHRKGKGDSSAVTIPIPNACSGTTTMRNPTS